MNDSVRVFERLTSFELLKLAGEKTCQSLAEISRVTAHWPNCQIVFPERWCKRKGKHGCQAIAHMTNIQVPLEGTMECCFVWNELALIWGVKNNLKKLNRL